MKKFSKILSVALLVALVLSLGVANAFAADITITRDPSYAEGATGNMSYTAYKIMDAEITGDLAAVDSATGELTGTPGTVVYYVTTQAKADALSGLKVTVSGEEKTLFDVTPSADGTRWNVTLKYEAATGEQIANAIDGVKDTFGPGTTLTREGSNDVEFTNLENGYYFITSTLGNKLAVQTLGSVEIKEKNKYPTVDKKQDDQAEPDYAEADVNVKVGDTIYYEITTTIPATVDDDVYLKDIMSEGLTYSGPLTFSPALTEDTDYSVVDSSDAKHDANATWQIKIHPTANTLGKTITITFTATVNDNAVKTDTTKQNKIELDYKNYHQEDTVFYKTYATGMVKYDGGKATEAGGVLTPKTVGDTTYLLQGAEFKLQVKNGSTWDDVTVVAENGYYRTLKAGETAPTTPVKITSDEKGEIIIRGLDSEQEYQLVETQAPAGGYNLATQAVALTLTQDAKKNVTISGTEDEDTTLLTAASVNKLANNKGTQLPSTGGIGTTIFYVVGGVLVLAAIILLVTKKRMSE